MIEEKLTIAKRKMKQYENQQILRENQIKGSKAKLDFRRKVLVGEMFLKYFPIALEFTPGKSSEEDEHIFELLDNFMESLSMCHQCFQIMEDSLSKSQ